MAWQRSEKYWERRAKARIDAEQHAAEQRLKALITPYRNAQKSILGQIRAVQSAYMRRYGLSEEDMRKFLSEPADEATLKRLAKAVAEMPEGPDKRRLKGMLNAPATRHRINNLQALRESVKANMETLSEKEQRMTTDSLTRTIRRSYLEGEFDLQQRSGFLWSPAGLSSRFVRQTLREDWSGETYRTRIVGRYEDLGKRIQEAITEGFLGGRNTAHMSEEIAHEFQSSYYAAKRLLVTETTYVTNAANLETYKEERVKEYRIVAVLDLRTSDICQEQDGKIYNVADAEPGKNMPPFHPNCRSTTISVISREWLNTVERKARDPVTGEAERIPPNMTYKEWLARLEQKYGKEKIDALRAEQKRDVATKNKAMQAKIDRTQSGNATGKMLTANQGNGIIDMGVRADWKDVPARSAHTTPNGFAAFPDGDPLNEYVAEVAPYIKDGIRYYDAAMHGNPTSVGFATEAGVLNARELAAYIKHRDDYNGSPVRLLACSTGKPHGEHDTCFAEELANALGVIVRAPTEDIYFYKGGKFTVGPLDEGYMRDIDPNERRRIGLGHI